MRNRLGGSPVVTCSCGRRAPCRHAGEHGLIPVLGILAAAGVGLVIDQLVNNGEIGATLFNAFFAAVQALGDAVFAGIEAMIGALPDAGDLGIEVPTGIVQGYALLNTFLPLAEALVLAGLALAAYGTLFAWRLAVMIYHLIPKPLMGT